MAETINFCFYMKELTSLTPLEYLLIGLVALVIFLFFRACWHNIQAGRNRG